MSAYKKKIQNTMSNNMHSSTLTYKKSFDEVDNPTHIVKCTGATEFAFVVSLTSKQAAKKSWFNSNEDDDVAVAKLNDTLPELTELNTFFTAKIKRSLAEFYVGEKIVSFAENVIFDVPDAIFFQRFSPRLKTFDLVAFYGANSVTFSMLDKSEVDIIRNWYTKKIYSCGLDPLPLTSVKARIRELLKDSQDCDPYDTVYNELFNFDSSEDSDSDYQPDEFCDTESESEVEDEEESDEEDHGSDGSGEDEEDHGSDGSDEDEDHADGEEFENPKKRRKI